jgi:DNA-binding protein HU-beta
LGSAKALGGNLTLNLYFNPHKQELGLAVSILIYIFAVSNNYNFKSYHIMTKADLVGNISSKTGMEKGDVQATVEALMEEVKDSLEGGENVYLRGFGSFIVKKRAAKTGRNISKNTTIQIPAHNIPDFKPAKTFLEGVKEKVKVKD